MQIIKIGGGQALNIEGILKGLRPGEKNIVVHGANFEMKKMLQELNMPEVFLTSPSGQGFRYSDARTMEIFTAAYSGLVNKRIVALATGLGLNPIGLSGVDGKLWLCERKRNVLAKDETGKVKAVKDNFHGKVIQVNAGLIESLLEQKYLPIITAPGVTAEGEIVNVDNDTAIAAMAQSLPIKRIISFIEAPGILRDFADETSLISQLKTSELEDLLAGFSARMKKKIMGAARAFGNQLEELIITDGRVREPFNFDFNTRGSRISLAVNEKYCRSKIN